MVNQALKKVLESHTVSTLRKEINKARRSMYGATSKMKKAQLISHMLKTPSHFKHLRMNVKKRKTTTMKQYNIKRVQAPELMYPVRTSQTPELMYPVRTSQQDTMYPIRRVNYPKRKGGRPKGSKNKKTTKRRTTASGERIRPRKDAIGLSSLGLGLSGGAMNRRRLMMALRRSM